MSKPYSSLMTVWEVKASSGDWGLGGFESPIVIKCDYEQNGDTSLTDTQGTLFVPKSRFWTDLEVVFGSLSEVPDNTWYIQRGDHRDVPDPTTVGGEEIRGRVEYDNGFFGMPPEYMFAT